MNPARHTSSTPNSSSTMLMVPSNSARLPYSLWSTTCEGQTNTLTNGKNKIIDRTGLFHTYPCLDASQRCPLQALNSRSVGDDHHNLCRAGRTLGLVYQCLQVGACDHRKKDISSYNQLCQKCSIGKTGHTPVPDISTPTLVLL